MVDNKSEAADFNDPKLIIEQWRTVISVQMHFNEMISRMRQLTATVGFGGGAVAISKPTENELLFKFCYLGFTKNSIISISIIMFAISVLIIDRFYYFKMLVSSVDLVKEQEARLPIAFNITTSISKRTSQIDALIPMFFLYGGLTLGHFVLFCFSLK